MTLTDNPRARCFRLQSPATALAVCALAVGLVTWLILASLPPSEPVWKGHKLSEWLDAWGRNLYFSGQPERQSRFSDQQCAQALDGIGDRALPCLRYWMTARPGRIKPVLNKLLDRQHWIRFRYDDGSRFQSLAASGFLFYGPAAKPLLPELLKLTHSRDQDTRDFAFELAFFTRPDRDVFLPLANRGLQEKDLGVQEMSAQWMEQRFPDDAEKAGLRTRFPLWFPKDKQLVNTNSPAHP